MPVVVYLTVEQYLMDLQLLEKLLPGGISWHLVNNPDNIAKQLTKTFGFEPEE